MKKCKYPDEICGLATVVKGVSYCNSVPCSLKDDVKIVKCKNCKNNTLLFAEDVKGEKVPFYFCHKVNDSLDIKEKRECEHYERATNLDVVRNMKPEELAYIIMCPTNVDPDSCIGNEKHCIKCCLEWLNRPVEE